MHRFSEKAGLDSIIRDELERVLGTYKPRTARVRLPERTCPCGCDQTFKPTRETHVFLDPSHGRRAHYLSFSVAKIRRDLAKPRRVRRAA